MKRKIIFAFTLVTLFASFRFAHAQVKINEFVPYGATEWVELLNTSDSEISLSGWSLVDAANHVKLLTALGTIPAHGIIVYEYNASSSGWLNNDADSIELHNAASEQKDKVSYGTSDLTVPSTGKSAALISGIWQAEQEPTKGEANSSGSSSSDNNNDDNTDSNNDDEDEDEDEEEESSSSSAADAPASDKITLELSVRNIGYVGIPLQFQGRVLQGREQIYRGRYFWNFGDGDFREVRVINRDKFTHIYFYPGDYTLVFEYYTDSFAEDPSVSRTMDIKVIDPAVVISRVGDTSDFFVELANNTDYEADLSGWVLQGLHDSFTLPKNTAIAAHRKIIVPGRISGLTTADISALKLANPGGETAFEYFAYTPPVAQKKKSTRSSEPQKNNETGLSPEESTPEDDLSLQAAVGALDEEDSSSLAPALWFVVFLTFLGTAIWAVHLIRRKRTPARSGEDFELLEE